MLRNRVRRRHAIRGLMLLALLSAAPLSAQDGGPALPNSDVAESAIGQLRSPYCPGLMLEVCPSPQAAALRDSIRVMAADGQSTSAIVESVLQRHGEQWRALPKRSGIGLWAWLVPVVALALGAAVVMARLRRGRQDQARYPAPQPEISADDRDRLAVALRQWDRGEGVDS